MTSCVFLFGEAEKGEFCTPLYCKSLSCLSETLGNPPGVSQGIHFAVQTILYQRGLIFFRVKEEGFSVGDYMRGFKLLKNQEISHKLNAIYLPGVGDSEIIGPAADLCYTHKTLLIITEKDLYDYLTNK